MTNFDLARRNMVESQVRSNDVTDVRIQDAMGRIPRERFVPKSKQALAYSDTCIEGADGRTIMDPRSFAKLLQAAQVSSEDVVLDIACGTGYSTAIIGALASAVVGVEAKETQVEEATTHLTDLGVDNAAVVKADLTAGVPNQGPYDVIFINGAVEELPDTLFSQLRAGGRLVCIFAENGDSQGRVYSKGRADADQTIGFVDVFDAHVPLLEVFRKPETFVF